MSDQFYQFTAVRGIQAKREYYMLSCPMKLVPKIFTFDDEEVPPEIRAQRQLNKGRIPEMKDYLLNNPESYIFSAITASIDEVPQFEAFGEEEHLRSAGILKVSMMARMIINDGQHRRSAIQEALHSNPDLGKEHIGVLLFVDKGLKRSQQMFADLNRYAIKPSTSISILYDHRDEFSLAMKRIVAQVDVFNGMVEQEKSSLSNRSRALFTLSGIYQATLAFLDKRGKKISLTSDEESVALEFWQTVAENMEDWKKAKAGTAHAATLRETFVHAHSIFLQALAIAGRQLIKEQPDNWKECLTKLKKIDWARTNLELWEGRAMLGGKMNKAKLNINLTVNALKVFFGLSLSKEEQELESENNLKKLEELQ